GATTYVIYDSVLVVNQKKDATAGEIRLASRDGSAANTWIYETLDSPNNTASVLGYDVAINKAGGKLIASWLAASGATLPNPSQIRVHVIDGETTVYTTTKYGVPNAPLNLNGTTLVVSCQKRLCALDTITKKISLISGWQSDDPIQNSWITVSGVRYLVAGINGQLVTLRA
ncbi:MAG: fibronectin type III domain-containing protein, partial [Candidatus Nanopelagicaceae bacterium]